MSKKAKTFYHQLGDEEHADHPIFSEELKLKFAAGSSVFEEGFDESDDDIADPFAAKRASRKVTELSESDEDDEDMFASDMEAKSGDNASSHRPGIADDASLDDIEDGDNGLPLADKYHVADKPPEFPIIPFDLKAEKAEGTFDEEGNYRWNKADSDDEEKAGPDQLDFSELDQTQLAKTLEARKRLQCKIEKEEADWGLFEKSVGLKGVFEQLLLLLEGNETPLKAIKRLSEPSESVSGQKKKPLVRRYIKPSERPAVDPKRKETINQITELCSNAIALGYTSIFLFNYRFVGVQCIFSVDIYEETSRMIKGNLDRLNNPGKRSSPVD